MCAVLTLTGRSWRARTHASTHTDKHSLACRQVGTDPDRAGNQTHRQLGIPGSRKAALGLCTPGQTDLGHGPPHAGPSFKCSQAAPPRVFPAR